MHKNTRRQLQSGTKGPADQQLLATLSNGLMCMCLAGCVQSYLWSLLLTPPPHSPPLSPTHTHTHTHSLQHRSWTTWRMKMLALDCWTPRRTRLWPRSSVSLDRKNVHLKNIYKKRLIYILLFIFLYLLFIIIYKCVIHILLIILH